MSALEAEEDADTPARAHWSLLSQGAAARVYGLDLCGLPAVAKHRHRKAYRIAALDGRLRRDRTLAEARALMGRLILLGREIASGAVTYLQRDASDGHPSETAYLVCRYVPVSVAIACPCA